jgi:hypothetical protein
MKVGTMTEIAMSHGLTEGRHNSSDERLAAVVMRPFLFSGGGRRMEAEEIFNRFPYPASNCAVTQFKVRIEHRVDHEISKQERDKLRRGLFVIGASNTARFQIFSQ